MLKKPQPFLFKWFIIPNLQLWTVTVKDSEALFPFPSVKVYVTVVTPRGKKDPGEWDLAVKVAAPESSVAVGSVQATLVPVRPNAMVLKMSASGVITGPLVSTAKFEQMFWNYNCYTIKGNESLVNF